MIAGLLPRAAAAKDTYSSESGLRLFHGRSVRSHLFPSASSLRQDKTKAMGEALDKEYPIIYRHLHLERPCRKPISAQQSVQTDKLQTNYLAPGAYYMHELLLMMH